jgi:hypothetical protein
VKVGNLVQCNSKATGRLYGGVIIAALGYLKGEQLFVVFMFDSQNKVMWSESYLELI